MILHMFSSTFIYGHDFRTTGFDKDLNLAYDVASSGWSSNHYTTDFGLDNSDSIYITGYHAAKFMSDCIIADSNVAVAIRIVNTVPNWESGQTSITPFKT